RAGAPVPRVLEAEQDLLRLHLDVAEAGALAPRPVQRPSFEVASLDVEPVVREEGAAAVRKAERAMPGVDDAVHDSAPGPPPRQRLLSTLPGLPERIPRTPPVATPPPVPVPSCCTPSPPSPATPRTRPGGTSTCTSRTAAPRAPAQRPGPSPWTARTWTYRTS